MNGASRDVAAIQWWLHRVPPIAWLGVLVSFLAGIIAAVAGQQSGALALVLPLVLGLILLFAARQYGAVTFVIVVIAIFVDFYQLIAPPLHEPVLWLLLAIALVVITFLRQSNVQPWVRVPHAGLWCLLLAVAGLAVPRGSISETGMYYITVFINALVMYIVGLQIVRTGRDLHWLLVSLTVIGAVVAGHSVIQGVTGTFLFATQHQTDYLGSVAGFHLAGTTINRAGSFLENPDWNGAFLAMMVFLPLGLAFEARSRAAKVAYATCCALDALALLFTFTTAAWFAAGCGVALYVMVFIPPRYRTRALAAICFTLVAIAAVFFAQVRLLLAHASANNEITLRVGAWETALRVILAHPLTGLGMAQSIYLTAAEPFRVLWQTRPLAHPHDSYLELAAFAGVPVLLAFIAVLVAVLRSAAANYRAAQLQYRPLIGGILAALCTLSANSVAINGWTLSVLAALGWLLAGAATAPCLRAAQPRLLAEFPSGTFRAAPILRGVAVHDNAVGGSKVEARP